MKPAVPVSVVVTAYNAETYVAAALVSIARQTVAPAEVVVVDDASTDRTRAVAEELGARVVVLPRNGGPSAARNAGFAATRERWVAFLDADDVWYEDKLGEQWSALQRWPDAAFCFTDYDVLVPGRPPERSENERHAAYIGIRRDARAGSAVRFDSSAFLAGLVDLMFVRQSSLVVRREAYLRSGGYDVRYRLAEDYEFLLRLIGQGPAIAIERPLVGYHRHPGSLSADPVAEVGSIDVLWDAVLARPERYPSGVPPLVRRRRTATLQEGALLGMRLGRFDEARGFLDKALKTEPSAKTLALYGLWSALDHPAGRRLHAAARTAWRTVARRSLPA